MGSASWIGIELEWWILYGEIFLIAVVLIACLLRGFSIIHFVISRKTDRILEVTDNLHFTVGKLLSNPSEFHHRTETGVKK